MYRMDQVHTVLYMNALHSCTYGILYEYFVSSEKEYLSMCMPYFLTKRYKYLRRSNTSLYRLEIYFKTVQYLKLIKLFH